MEHLYGAGKPLLCMVIMAFYWLIRGHRMDRIKRAVEWYKANGEGDVPTQDEMNKQTLVLDLVPLWLLFAWAIYEVVTH